jgi:hypothetical protein
MLPTITASVASHLRPVNISSFALDLPMILGRRCVAPALYITAEEDYPMKNIPWLSVSGGKII